MFLKYRKFHNKTPVLQSLANKLEGLFLTENFRWLLLKERLVYMLSPCHQADMTDVIIDDHIERKPMCVKEYNRHMGGADKVNQQLHSLHNLIETYK